MRPITISRSAMTRQECVLHQYFAPGKGSHPRFCAGSKLSIGSRPGRADPQVVAASQWRVNDKQTSNVPNPILATYRFAIVAHGNTVRRPDCHHPYSSFQPPALSACWLRSLQSLQVRPSTSARNTFAGISKTLVLHLQHSELPTTRTRCK